MFTSDNQKTAIRFDLITVDFFNNFTPEKGLAALPKVLSVPLGQEYGKIMHACMPDFVFDFLSENFKAYPKADLGYSCICALYAMSYSANHVALHYGASNEDFALFRKFKYPNAMFAVQGGSASGKSDTFTGYNSHLELLQKLDSQASDALTQKKGKQIEDPEWQVVIDAEAKIRLADRFVNHASAASVNMFCSNNELRARFGYVKGARQNKMDLPLAYFNLETKTLLKDTDATTAAQSLIKWKGCEATKSGVITTGNRYSQCPRINYIVGTQTAISIFGGKDPYFPPECLDQNVHSRFIFSKIVSRSTVEDATYVIKRSVAERYEDRLLKMNFLRPDNPKQIHFYFNADAKHYIAEALEQIAQFVRKEHDKIGFFNEDQIQSIIDRAKDIVKEVAIWFDTVEGYSSQLDEHTKAPVTIRSIFKGLIYYIYSQKSMTAMLSDKDEKASSVELFILDFLKQNKETDYPKTPLAVALAAHLLVNPDPNIKATSKNSLLRILDKMIKDDVLTMHGKIVRPNVASRTILKEKE